MNLLEHWTEDVCCLVATSPFLSYSWSLSVLSKIYLNTDISYLYIYLDNMCNSQHIIQEPCQESSWITVLLRCELCLHVVVWTLALSFRYLGWGPILPIYPLCPKTYNFSHSRSWEHLHPFWTKLYKYMELHTVNNNNTSNALLCHCLAWILIAQT